MKTALSIALALLATVTMATAQPYPLIKVGSCPAAYRESGGYCTPTNDPPLSRSQRASSAPADGRPAPTTAPGCRRVDLETAIRVVAGLFL
jgi:hypothetical protein